MRPSQKLLARAGHLRPLLLAHQSLPTPFPGTGLTTPEPNKSLSEYHGMGSVTGTFMVRHGRWKYIHSVAYAPLLFDLAADPEELSNRASDPACAGALADCRAVLQGICDPTTVDAAAKRRQAAQLALNGGRAAVIARGDLGFSPPPGTAVSFN